MAQHRGVAEWFAVGFEHGADVFCHHCGSQIDGAQNPSAAEPMRLEALKDSDHPHTDRAVPIGND